mmetsp:Transcript_25443/g.72956  ORF Transcript_25443/g.72956 Transcript_25443/m.72956 type:complete len:835 (+) Transcript_25443:96-2600(+)
MGTEHLEEGGLLYRAVFQLWGDPELKAEVDNLIEEREPHFFRYFQEFVEDTYRDLLAKRGLRGAELYVEEGSWISSSQALSFASREAVQDGTLRPTCPLTEALAPSVGRRLIDESLLAKLKEHYIPQFGVKGKGPALFEQTDAMADRWSSGQAGIEATGISFIRRRPCALRKPGTPMELEKAYKVSSAEFSLLAAEEEAYLEGTLVSEPHVSVHGNVMSLIRDTSGEMCRVLLYDQLPPGAARGQQGEALARSMFPRGTRLTVLEPLLAMARDGIRGMYVVSPSEVRKFVGGADSLNLAEAKAAGNAAVAQGQHATAAEFYRLGLNHANTEVLATLLSNRAQAELKLEQYAGALADTAAALQLRPTDSKAWARYVLALRGLGYNSLAARAQTVASGGRSAPADCGDVWASRAATRSAVLSAARTAATVVGPGEKPLGSEPIVGDAGILKVMANDDYQLGKFGTARGGYSKALACEKKAADTAAALGNLAHCGLVLGEFHNAAAAAAACLRFCPPAKVAAKAVHRLALALALLGETGIASEVLAAAPMPEGIGEVEKQCISMAEQVESLRVREDTGYSSASLVANAGGASANEAATPTAEWLGPVEAKSLGSPPVASRDMQPGEVVMVQRPLKGLTSGVHSLTAATAADMCLRMSSEGLFRRLAFASCADLAAARAIELLTAARQPGLLGFEPMPVGEVLGGLLQRLDPRLLPLLGQRPDFAPLVERLPASQPLIEAMVELHQLGPTVDWQRHLVEACGESPEPTTAGTCDAAAKRSLRETATGLYPAIALLRHISSHLANCALAPVGSQTAGALAVFTTKSVPCGAELLLAEAK